MKNLWMGFAALALAASQAAIAQQPEQEVVIVNQAAPTQVAASAVKASAAAAKAPVVEAAKPGQTEEELASSKMVEQIRSRMRKIDGMKKIPGTNMAIVEAGDLTLMVSDNGRFIVGSFRMVDMWNGKVITNIADLEGIDKVNLRKINANPDDLGAFTVGTGAKEVVMFVDPLCPHCHDLMKQIPSLSSEYTFKIVLLPILGAQSGEWAKKLVCTKDKTAAVKALIDDQLENAKLVTEKCDTSALAKAVVVARVLGVESVPYTITPKFNVIRGAVKDLGAALRNK